MAQISVLTDCVLVSGPATEVTAAIPRLSRIPRAVLLHTYTGDGGRVALLSGGEHVLTVPGTDVQAVALAAPLAQVTNALLAPSTELTASPLVRASRVFLESLSRHLPAGVSAGDRPVNDTLISLMRGIVGEQPHAIDQAASSSPLAARIVALIDVRHTDPRLDVASIARELHTSRRQLYRSSGGAGIAAMLAQRRVDTAKDLLATRAEFTIADVASRSGFASAAHLRAQLLRSAGVTPTEYRRRHCAPAER